MELHHIDGNRYNNELDNLQILCPNCHSLTPNHSGKLQKIEKQRKKSLEDSTQKKSGLPRYARNDRGKSE